MVYVVDGVHVRGVDIILEKDFLHFVILKLEIHSFMIQIRILSMILQMFSTTLHNLSTNHTRVSYVGTILTTVMIVHHGSRLSMSKNRATIKTLCQLRNQNYFESNHCYNPNSYGFDKPTQTSIDYQPPKEMSVRELLRQEKLHKTLQAVCEKLNQQEQAANVSTHTPEPSRCFNIIYDYDDDDNDDEESTNPLN
ncbi:hypothetical protein Tco_1349255 [Tanacetum coccineum]